jgi:dTDP-4-amino-4,6-dideoxygalactose transaminase
MSSAHAIPPAGSPAAPPSNVPLLDLARGNQPLRDELLAAIAAVIDSGRFLHGAPCGELEKAIAALCHTNYAIGCASGSDALLLALMALGIGPGDEVIVPAFTFFATASAVQRLGARPVFADVDPATLNLDPQSFAERITPRTRAVIPVHLFGQCADMNAILELSAKHRLAVIEDAAQAIGASYGNTPAGSIGRLGCFSFYPTKNLGGLGDGGMLTTSDAALAERLRSLANHGMSQRYHHDMVGINSRLDTIQAAALGVKLAHLQRWTEARQQNAIRFTRLFSQAGLDRWLTLPHDAGTGRHVWNQYTVRVREGRRDALRAHLAQAGIGSEVYYPVPLHRQQCFADLGYAAGTLPHTELAASEVLSLPIFPELTPAEQDAVVATVIGFYRGRSPGIVTDGLPATTGSASGVP